MGLYYCSATRFPRSEEKHSFNILKIYMLLTKGVDRAPPIGTGGYVKEYI